MQRPSCARCFVLLRHCVLSTTELTRSFSAISVPPVSSGDETIMGMIGTSVTKKLWQERLTKNKDRLKHLLLPSPTAKLPQQTKVTYPFSSDRFLQEQVRQCSCCVQRCATLTVLNIHSTEIPGIKFVLGSCWKIWTLWQETLPSSIGELGLLSQTAHGCRQY